ncbi:MAG: hypothetical protein AAF618_04815 [Pseudomonadota bacterium]
MIPLRTAATSFALVVSLAIAAPASALGIDPFFPMVSFPETSSDLSTKGPLPTPTPQPSDE